MPPNAFANVDKIILAKAGSNFQSRISPLGLRYQGKISFSEDSIGLENEVSYPNYRRVQVEGETAQCDYAMLKKVFEDYLPDQMVEAHVVSAPQQAAPDARGLKGQEVFNFAYAPAGNGYLGIKFKYTEEFAAGKSKTSALFTLPLSLERSEMDSIQAAAKVSATALTDTYNHTSVSPNHLVAIEYPAIVNLFEKPGLESYKLEIESAGDGESIYARPNNDYVIVTLELLTKADSSIEKYRSILNTSMNSHLYIVHKISDTEYFRKQINLPGRQASLEISNKRQLKVVFKKKYPMLAVTCSSSVTNSITTNQILFE